MTWSLSIKKRSFLAVSFCVLSIYGYLRRSQVHDAAAVAESVTLKSISPNGTNGARSSSSVPHRNVTPTELLTIHFPQCHLPSNTSWMTWLRDYGYFITTTNAQEPRYDHWCPVMKARYNCAWPRNIDTSSQQPPQQLAYQYHFVWKHPHYSQVCDLHQLLDFVGGPASIMSRGHVLLQGNSYLRQVWEALVCRYSHQMTHLTLYHNGPPTSMAYIQSRRGKLLTPRELGNLVVEPDLQSIPGCHGPHPRTPMNNYYRPNVSVPSNRDKCTDDMATVKFGTVQFTFMFHPSRFHIDALHLAYQQLGIQNNGIDTMVWMGDDERELRNLTNPHSRIDLGPLLPLLITRQNETVGYYFGADNPWITHPPDNHPCMPGIPDDEANILLWLLLLSEYTPDKNW